MNTPLNQIKDHAQPSTSTLIYFPATPISHTARASWLALIVLCLAWELVLAPVQSGSGRLAFKALPLLCAVPGLWHRKVYTLQWASLLIWFYFTEGVVRATSDPGASRWYASVEVILCLLFFWAAMCTLRPIKQAAKKQNAERMAEKLEKASRTESTP